MSRYRHRPRVHSRRKIRRRRGPVAGAPRLGARRDPVLCRHGAGAGRRRRGRARRAAAGAGRRAPRRPWAAGRHGSSCCARSASLWLEEERIHPEIVRTLEKMYAESPNFAALAEQVGMFRAVGDLAKIWVKVKRLRALLAFEVGNVVWMEGHGAGRVADINMALGSFRVDFDRVGRADDRLRRRRKGARADTAGARDPPPGDRAGGPRRAQENPIPRPFCSWC